MLSINSKRLLGRIYELGRTGLDKVGRRTRLAASDTNKLSRDLVVSWMKEAGLKVVVDRIGNIFAIWSTPDNEKEQPMLVGSHLDTVVNAGQYDGAMGVLTGLEVIQTLKEASVTPKRPLITCVFTNEEGVRYHPDMLGSLVFSGGYPVDKALAAVGTDGTILGEELKRIGYAGTAAPGFFRPYAFLEYHIEQGPVLAAEGYDVAAVAGIQGIHWFRIKIHGAANHAGTTPIRMRRDAGLAAAKFIIFCRELAEKAGGVATVGTIAFRPNAVNVIPSEAEFTIDVRNPDKEALDREDAAIRAFAKQLEQNEQVTVDCEQLTHFDPVPMSDALCRMVEQAAADRHLKAMRLVSGACQDSQMLARICPTAMVFAPSVAGISHSPDEFTKDEDVVKGANVFLDVVSKLVIE